MYRISPGIWQGPATPYCYAKWNRVKSKIKQTQKKVIEFGVQILKDTLLHLLLPQILKTKIKRHVSPCNVPITIRAPVHLPEQMTQNV